jgi:macrolide transport system ATP-binding/permease protein
VNEAFVRAYGLAGRALGARVRAGDREPWLEIVGMVADAKYAALGEARRPILYRALFQTGGNLFVVARTAGTPAGSIAALRRALTDVDRRALVEVRTMRDATSLEVTLRRLGAWLLGAIGALGLGLALIGLYGVVSYAVSRGTREIGIRLALGAPPSAVLRAVLRDGLALVGAGVLAGTLVSIGAAQGLRFLKGGVSTADPVSLVVTATLLLAAGLGASYGPGRRATRVDPLVALRQE